MTSPPYSPSAALAEHERKYFVPLMEKLELREIARHDSLPNWAAIDAVCGSIIVRLEYERGMLALCAAAASDANRFWEVELIAEIFPRIKLIPGGVQRLSLDEQAAFLGDDGDVVD